jgi:hypothetical protein
LVTASPVLGSNDHGSTGDRQHTPDGIVNLSKSFRLREPHCHLLLKSLSFVPTPKIIDKTDQLQAIDALGDRLKSLFTTNHPRRPTETEQLFRPPPTKSQPPTNFPPEITEITTNLKQAVRKLDRRNKDEPNFEKVNAQALKELKENSELVIKSADKGAAIVIMDRDDYVLEASRQLNTARHYRKLDEPIFQYTCHTYNQILKEMSTKKLITPKIKNYLWASPEARERIFYLLPKIHKEPHKWTIPDRVPPGRPIVSDIQSESCAIAEFIDAHLGPFATSHPSYVKNTYDFLDKLRKLEVSRDTLLISLDVDSLYTNIPNDLGLRAVNEAFNRDRKPIHDYILRLLELSLTKNDFEFDGQHYLQISGTAMGKKFAPKYADIVLSYWEASCLPKCPLQPALYLRYLDDIFLIWNHSREAFDQFFQILNSENPNITLKHNIQEECLEFLDVQVYKNFNHSFPQIPSTKVYFKPTDSHALLHAQSYHPKHTFDGIVKSQVLRFHRICSTESDFNEACTILFKALTPRGYNARKLRKIKAEIVNSRSPSLENATITPCGGPHCSICPLIRTEPWLDSAKGRIYINQSASCNTRNAIYAIGCHICPTTLYVGQTKDVRQRILTHLSDIRLKKDTATAYHFSPPHSHRDLFFSVLESFSDSSLLDSPETLDKAETKWIDRLDTFNKGLNRDRGNSIQVSIPFIIKHSDQSSIITKQARALISAKLTNKKWAGIRGSSKNIEINILQANRTNQKISQKLVRSKLPEQNPND